MKPSRLFINPDDFSNRFKDTFIYYKGEPKYVHSCMLMKHGDPDSYAFSCYDFNPGLDYDKKAQIILLDDEGVNFRQYNLGYARFNEYGAMWIARAPMRQWKQGLRRDQCQAIGYSDDIDSQMTLHPCSYTYDMLMNSYMPVDKAMEYIRSFSKRAVKVPIHKNFALFTDKSTAAAPAGLKKKLIRIEYKGSCISDTTGTFARIVNDSRYLLDIPEYAKLLNQALDQ